MPTDINPVKRFRLKELCSRAASGLRSAQGQAWVFLALWVAGVLMPLAAGAMLSVLRRRGLHVEWGFTLHGYRDLIESGRFGVVLQTVKVGAIVSLLCLACGFPLAYWLAKRARSNLVIQSVWICLTVPFFLDPAARTLALRLMLGSQGIVNDLLVGLHLSSQPVRWLLFSDFSVYLGLVGPYFPNMVWPIYLSIMLIDDGLIEASHDLGAGSWATFRYTLAPLAVPGVLAGLIMTFIPVLGDGVVPSLLGGERREYLADAVLSLSTSMNYTAAAGLATILLVLLALMLLGGLLAYRAAVSGREPAF